MPVQIQLRRGTASEWTSSNPTLSAGELGLETDTKKFKIGDGTTAWSSLAYATLSPTDISAAFGVANAAFANANSTHTFAIAAYNAQNADYTTTNAAFGVANAAFANANSTHTFAIAAYNAANSASGSSGNGYTTLVGSLIKVSPADAGTYYWGASMSYLNSFSANTPPLVVPAAGFITKSYVHTGIAGVVGTNETTTISLRVNTTEYTLGTMDNSTNNAILTNTTINVAVSAGDTIMWKLACPTWSTNPTNMVYAGTVFIRLT